MCCGSLITLLLSNFNLLGVHLLFIKSLCCCADHPCSRLCLQSRRAVIKNLKNMQHVRESASPAVSVTFRISKVVQLQCVFCNKRGLQSNNSPSAPSGIDIAEWLVTRQHIQWQTQQTQPRWKQQCVCWPHVDQRMKEGEY